MDKISIVAVLGGLTAILAGQALEGGHLGSLLQLTAFLIVIGGTASAVMLQSTPKQFVTGLRMARWVFSPPLFEYDKQIREIVTWSQTSRRGGLLALEGFVNSQKDPFTKKALQMLVDGGEPQSIREVLEPSWIATNTAASKPPRSGNRPVATRPPWVFWGPCWA